MMCKIARKFQREGEANTYQQHHFILCILYTVCIPFARKSNNSIRFRIKVFICELMRRDVVDSSNVNTFRSYTQSLSLFLCVCVSLLFSHLFCFMYCIFDTPMSIEAISIPAPTPAVITSQQAMLGQNKNMNWRIVMAMTPWVQTHSHHIVI